MTPELPESVVEAINDGDKIEAIKRLREASGMDLASAKAAVEHYSRPTRSGEPSEAVRSALAAGRKIEAIKLYREEHGVGLREARLEVEALQHETASPEAYQTSGGWRSLVSVLLAVAVLIAVYVWLTPG
ncbi:MAG: hypothetical protein QNJ05_11265 [Woeseiaceae bacterium]|nr:hypothetical protein [Woeseiaceae bacterium]